MRCIQLTFNPFADVGGLLCRRQTLVEHELCNSGCRRNLHLEDLGLTRKQHALGAKFRPHLIRARLRCDDETLIGDASRPRHVRRKPEGWVDIEIIGLPGMKGFALDRDLGELDAGGK